MPTLAALLASLAFSTLAFAPAASAQEIDALRAAAKTEAGKRAYVGQALALTDAEGKRFWPVYDAYQRKLDANNRKLARAIEDAVAAGPMTDARAKKLAGEWIAVDDADLRARRSASNAAMKAVPPLKAMRYLQIENKLQATYRADLAANLPLVQ
jgi:Spy/CpxP family protein refolding chaperone